MAFIYVASSNASGKRSLGAFHLVVLANETAMRPSDLARMDRPRTAISDAGTHFDSAFVIFSSPGLQLCNMLGRKGTKAILCSRISVWTTADFAWLFGPPLVVREEQVNRPHKPTSFPSGRARLRPTYLPHGVVPG